jgi:hypothetical protein
MLRRHLVRLKPIPKHAAYIKSQLRTVTLKAKNIRNRRTSLQEIADKYGPIITYNEAMNLSLPKLYCICEERHTKKVNAINAIKIQKAWKQFRIKKVILHSYNQLHKSVIIIQRWWRKAHAHKIQAKSQQVALEISSKVISRLLRTSYALPLIKYFKAKESLTSQIYYFERYNQLVKHKSASIIIKLCSAYKLKQAISKLTEDNDDCCTTKITDISTCNTANAKSKDKRNIRAKTETTGFIRHCHCFVNKHK